MRLVAWAPFSFLKKTESSTHSSLWSNMEHALLPRYLPLICPKKTGVAYDEAMREVEDMYGQKKIKRGEGVSVVVGQILHLTVHSIPGKIPGGSPSWLQPRLVRLVVIGILAILWLLYYPFDIKLRSIICAAVYSCTEYTFTLFERNTSYTSFEQFWGNLLYVPVLLEVYGYYLGENPVAYILLFPMNIWILEVVEGGLLMWVYGRHVAWNYSDYSDCFCFDCCRLGHAPFWLGLGAACYFAYPMLQSVTTSSSPT